MNLLFVFFSSMLLLGGLNLLCTDDVVVIPLHGQIESDRSDNPVDSQRDQYETSAHHSRINLSAINANPDRLHGSRQVNAVKHLVLANKAHQQGDYGDEVLHLMDALLTDPEHQQTRLRLAESLLSNGRYELAREILDQALIYHPDTPTFIAMRARLYLHAGDLMNASSLLSNALIRFQNNEEILALAASIHDQREEYLKAANLYQQLTLLYPLKLGYQVGYAMAIDHAGDTDTATLLYQKIAEKLAASGARLPFVDQRLAMITPKLNLATR